MSACKLRYVLYLSFTTFFSDTGAGKYIPRTVFLDLEPSAVGAGKLRTWLVNEIIFAYLRNATFFSFVDQKAALRR